MEHTGNGHRVGASRSRGRTPEAPPALAGLEDQTGPSMVGKGRNDPGRRVLLSRNVERKAPGCLDGLRECPETDSQSWNGDMAMTIEGRMPKRGDRP